MWEKQVPNEAGYWLRVNAGHQVQLHQVIRINNVLKIAWGWSGNKKLCNVVDIADKLKCFYWRGVIPEPPEQAL